MKNICPKKKLLNYLQIAEKEPSAKIPEKLAQHAKVCAICSRILKNQKLQKAFIYSLTCEETPGDKIRKAKKRTEISEIKPGQLWKIKIPKANENILAITTSTLIKEAGIKAVRITPLCTTHSEKDTDETDIILEPGEMPLGLLCLAQWWNDRPVLLTQLSLCYGELSKDITDKILTRISEFPKPVSLSASGHLFRQIEIDKGKIISAPLFEKISQAEKPKTNVYLIDFSDFTTNANEELAMAAASNDIYLKDFEQYIIKNNLPFACIRMPSKKPLLQLRSTNENKFKLEITFKDASTKNLISDMQGIANIDLPPEETKRISSVAIIFAP